LSVLGGALVLTYFGTGPLSLDARMKLNAPLEEAKQKMAA
jgi:hypothetical protein